MSVMDPMDPQDNGSIDESTLTRLLTEVGPELLGYIEGKMPPAFRAFSGPEDVFQDTCIQAYRSRETFRMIDPDSFRQWIWRVAHNVLIDLLRHGFAAKRQAGKIHVTADSQVALLSNVYGVKPTAIETPSRVAARREAVVKVQVGLSSLPDDQRQAITLHVIQGLTLAESAQSMGRTVDSIRGLLQRGQVRMRELLGDPALYFSKIEPMSEASGPAGGA